MEAEALAFLREWARAGFPHRADGSFPSDFLTAMRILMELPDTFSTRRLEEALVAGPDFDYVLRSHSRWSWDDTRRAHEHLR